MEGHNDAIAATAFTPDSQYLITACSDGHMKLWCVAPCSEQCLLTQEDAHDLGVQSCDFSPIEGIAGNTSPLSFRNVTQVYGHTAVMLGCVILLGIRNINCEI